MLPESEIKKLEEARRRLLSKEPWEETMYFTDEPDGSVKAYVLRFSSYPKKRWYVRDANWNDDKGWILTGNRPLDMYLERRLRPLRLK